MNCLVLGGGGFLGSHLCEALLMAGHKVRVFERPRLKIDFDHTDISGDHRDAIEWVEGDITNLADVQAAVEDIEIIFHLVCTTLPKTSNDNPCYDVESNVMSTLRLLKVAKDSGVRKVIFASSGGTVYGIPQQVPIAETHPTDPVCSYGIAKLTIEKYLHLFHSLYGLDYCILRFSNPYGERQRTHSLQGAVAVFLYKALKNEKIEIWGDGSVRRDFIYIKDAIDAFIKSMNYNGECRIFNIGSGNSHSVNDLLKLIDNELGRSVARNYTMSRTVDVPVNVLDISRARHLLHWTPLTSLEDGLRRTVFWMRAHYREELEKFGS